jgi:hypothetical protein
MMILQRKNQALQERLAFSCLWKSFGFSGTLQLLPDCARDRFATNCPRSSPLGLFPWFLNNRPEFLVE